MYRLLLDSSDTDLSVGIAENGLLIYSYSAYAWQRQSEYMIPEIEKALKACNITLKDISSVSVGKGPGSYTGVRIPLTIAKTLNVANKADIIALSSLAVMGKADEDYIALINARSRRSYIGIYSHGQVVLPDQVMENEKITELIKPYLEKGFVLKGSLDYLHYEDYQKADVVNGLLSWSLISSPCDNPKALCPVYLKD